MRCCHWRQVKEDLAAEYLLSFNLNKKLATWETVDFMESMALLVIFFTNTCGIKGLRQSVCIIGWIVVKTRTTVLTKLNNRQYFF